MKKWICIIAGTIAGFLAGWFVFGSHDKQAPPSRMNETDVSTIVSTDTLRQGAVAAKDTLVAGYAKVKLPRVREAVVSSNSESMPDTESGGQTEGITADSAEVVIPISRYTFEDSIYRAVVSGWGVKLDTMEVYARREVVTVKKPPNRWVIGPSIGVAVTGKGIMPYIGIGVTYNLLK